MKNQNKAGKIGGVILGSALMFMLAGTVEISAAPKGLKAADGNTIAGQVGASAGASAVRGAAPPAKPASQTTAAAAQSTPPGQQPEEPYRYHPEGRIDPFKPFIDLEVAAKKKVEQTKALPLNPLQRVGVEQFKLVGIIEDSQGRRAMVQDATGKFYSLGRGTHIGLNKGRVINILKDSVIVNENVMMDEGKTQSRKHIMKLRRDEVKP